jgi:hypothetical protein
MGWDRNLVDDDRGDRMLARSTPPALEIHRESVDQQLTTPHAVDLAARDRLVEAHRASTATAADHLGAGDLEVVVREEEVRQCAMSVGTAGWRESLRRDGDLSVDPQVVDRQLDVSWFEVGDGHGRGLQMT